MSPKDFSSVFSRSFVVGHFLPAFFALAVAALATTADALPTAYRDSHALGAKLLALGIAALPAGLLLSGMHAHVLRMFAGQATERQIAEDHLTGRGKTWRRPLRRIIQGWHVYRVKRQQRRYDAWRSRETVLRKDPIAALSFDQWFPRDRDRMLPTRLGNAIRAFQSHADSRYGLDGALIWPHVEMLLTDDERQLIDDARTDVAFFVNCAVCTAVIGLWLAVDAAVNRHNGLLWLTVQLAAAALLILAFRLLAVTATYRWGTPVRAAMDLHRLDMYDHLGVRRPSSAAEEFEQADAVNAWLRGQKRMPDGMWTQEGRSPQTKPATPQPAPDR